MGSERNFRERGWKTFEFEKGFQKVFAASNDLCSSCNSKRLSPVSRGGLRGASTHRWWRGRRKPHFSGRGSTLGCFSVFIDGLPNSVHLFKLKKLFEDFGEVIDTFISRKVRTWKKDTFGFIRFRRKCEAVRAINVLNGSSFAGKKLFVSMAKYQKGGTPFYFKNHYAGYIDDKDKVRYNSTSFSSYSDVKRITPGKKRGVTASFTTEPSNGKDPTLLPDSENHVTPVLFTSQELVKTKLSQPELVENVETNDTSKSASKLRSTGLDVDRVCLKGSNTVEDIINNEPLCDDGVAQREISSVSEMGQTPGSVHTLKTQEKIGPKPKRILNARDVAVFLGYYSKAKEVVTQESGVLLGV